MGWRAVRIGLDRPALLRYQLRALINAAAGRRLRVMFPLVTTVSEFDAARALADRELEWGRAHGRKPPSLVEIGVMVEAPALAWSIPDLKGRVDFISIGTNDLMQYFFAADRGNARVSERYDILSAPALRFLKRIREDADAARAASFNLRRSCRQATRSDRVCGLGFPALVHASVRRWSGKADDPVAGRA